MSVVGKTSVSIMDENQTTPIPNLEACAVLAGAAFLLGQVAIEFSFDRLLVESKFHNTFYCTLLDDLLSRWGLLRVWFPITITAISLLVSVWRTSSFFISKENQRNNENSSHQKKTKNKTTEPTQRGYAVWHWDECRRSTSGGSWRLGTLAPIRPPSELVRRAAVFGERRWVRKRPA